MAGIKNLTILLFSTIFLLVGCKSENAYKEFDGALYTTISTKEKGLNKATFLFSENDLVIEKNYLKSPVVEDVNQKLGDVTKMKLENIVIKKENDFYVITGKSNGKETKIKMKIMGKNRLEDEEGNELGQVQ